MDRWKRKTVRKDHKNVNVAWNCPTQLPQNIALYFIENVFVRWRQFAWKLREFLTNQDVVKTCCDWIYIAEDTTRSHSRLFGPHPLALSPEHILANPHGPEMHAAFQCMAKLGRPIQMHFHNQILPSAFFLILHLSGLKTNVCHWFDLWSPLVFLWLFPVHES